MRGCTNELLLVSTWTTILPAQAAKATLIDARRMSSLSRRESSSSVLRPPILQLQPRRRHSPLALPPPSTPPSAISSSCPSDSDSDASTPYHLSPSSRSGHGDKTNVLGSYPQEGGNGEVVGDGSAILILLGSSSGLFCQLRMLRFEFCHTHIPLWQKSHRITHAKRSISDSPP